MTPPRPRPEASSAGGLPVAVDAMGGDNAPGEIVAGARRAVEELGIPVVLVGPPDQIGDTGGLEVIPASEIIAMDDDPGSSVRRKKDSSLVRAAEAVRDGKALAMVSAGNTGAAMASALAAHGPAQRRRASRHRHAHPPAGLASGGAPRRRCECRVHTGHAGAVRPDGRGLRLGALRRGAADRGAVVDRRGEVQGHAAREGDPRAVGRRRPTSVSSATPRAATSCTPRPTCS